MDRLINTYDLTARVAPITFALAPTLIGLLTLTYLVGSVKFAFVIAILLLVITPIVRESGKSREEKLFCNPQPVADFLSYYIKQKPENAECKEGDEYYIPEPENEYYISTAVKEKCHKKISSILEEFNLPADADDENSWSEQKKKDIYEIAGNCLIDIMRHQGKWEIIYDKNVRFGFVRNLYSVKCISIILNLLTLAIMCFYLKAESICLVSLFKAYINDSTHPSLDVKIFLLLIIYIVFTLISIIILVFFVSRKRVVKSAYEYAKHLMISTLYYDEVMYGGTNHKQGELNDD